MRYLRMPTRDSYEAAALPRHFDKMHAPVGRVSLARSVRFGNQGVELVVLDDEVLAIEPETASWAFLTRAEEGLFRTLDGKDFGWLQQRWPTNAQARPEDFAARLFRRGLLSLNGLRSVDPTIFRDSPNSHDSHLVELLLTEKCNLGCGYCLASAHPNMPSMSEEVAFKTVDLAFSMSEASTFTFEFAGGEPFLKFDLMTRVVEYIKSHPRRGYRPANLAVQTNCTLLNEKRVEWIKREGITVGVSLDGSPQSHNRSRPQVNGKESFSKVKQGIDLLRAYQVPFGVLVVLNRFNIESAQELLDFLTENQIAGLKLNPIAYLGTARSAWGAFGLTSEEVTHYFQEFARLIVERRYVVLEDNLRTMAEYLMSKQRGTRCMRTHCGAGETFQTINASGEIFPCGRSTQSPELAIGNVNLESVSLSAPGAGNQFVQKIKRRKPQDLEGCMSCNYRQLCQAGCSVQAFERYGTVGHRTPECDFYKAMYPFLLRWLTFDVGAVRHLNRVGYFGDGAEIVIANHLASGSPHAVAQSGTKVWT